MITKLNQKETKNLMNAIVNCIKRETDAFISELRELKKNNSYDGASQISKKIFKQYIDLTDK